MLTTDDYIDRRIILQGNGLESLGWKVTIISTPTDQSKPDDPRVVRLSGKDFKQKYIPSMYHKIRHWPILNQSY